MWWFVSLNVLQGFFNDLWLNVPARSLQRFLQARIDPEIDLPTFGSDPRTKAYRMLASFRDQFGGQFLENMCAWQKFVFVQGGDDRVEESVWESVSYELFQRAADLRFSEQQLVALRQFREIREIRFADFKKRLLQVSQAKLSQWDQMVINAEGASLDVVLDLVTNVCSLNIFTATWHEVCTAKGSEFLQALFVAALKVASEDTSGRLVFSADTLPFPSSWEFDLGGSSAQARFSG